MASFSERMKSEAQTAWDTILAHRFFREIAEDAIEDAVFGRYLDIEYSFVDTAAAALGYAVAKAPSFRERRHLALGLHGLVTDQEQFFATAFEQIGRRAPESGSPRPGLAAPLHGLFLTVARDEPYEEILACTLGAEWLYLTWCSRAAGTPSSRAAIREWVALHAGGPFAGQVAWTRAEIDARGPNLSMERQARLCRLFEQVLVAEAPFHDAAYG